MDLGEHWGCPWASLGGPQTSHPQQLVGGLPDGVHEEVTVWALLWCISSSGLLWLSLALNHAAHLNILDGGDRSPLGQCPTLLGSQVPTHMLSLAPTREIMD